MHPSLRQSRGFGDALQVAREEKPSVAHHLAAETTLQGFAGPQGVVMRLNCWQAIRERHGREPDPGNLITAVDRLPTGRGSSALEVRSEAG